jgi:transcriptional activator of cad operon
VNVPGMTLDVESTSTPIVRRAMSAAPVDGRKADSTLRVAARLVRADTGYVIWSGTYDRQSDTVLKIQGDVAAEVTQALRDTLQTLPTATGSVR